MYGAWSIVAALRIPCLNGGDIMNETITRECAICGNSCFYDEESVESDMYNINGIDVCICGCCMDDIKEQAKE